MKKNHLLWLLAVAVVVGLAGIYFQISQYAGWNDAKTDRTIFQNLAINDITKIQIRSAPASVTLEKKDDAWGVAERQDYPADFAKIRDLVKMLWGLKAGQEMQIGPSQLGRLKLLAPDQGAESGIEVDLKGERANEIASLIIGKSVDRSNGTSGSSSTGRFLYNPAVKDRVFLVSEPFFSVDPVSIGSWLDKMFITPGELAEIDQAAWSNNPGWKLIRKDPKADWQLEDVQPGETLDKSFAESFSNFAPTFTDVRPISVSPDETGLNDPFKVAIKTFDGFLYDLVLGKEGPDKTRYLQLTVSANLPSDQKDKNLKARLEKEKRFEKWVYLVPDWNLEQILKRRNEILSKSAPSTTSTAAPLPAPAATASPTPIGTPNPEPIPARSPSPSGTPTAEPVAPPSPTPIPESSPSASLTPGDSPSPNPSPAPAS